MLLSFSVTVTTAPCGTDQFANLWMNMCDIPPKKRKCDFQMTGNQLVTLISPTEIVLKLPQNTSASFPIWGLIQASQAEVVWNVTPYKIDVGIVPLNAFKPEVSEPSDQVAEHQQRSSFFIVHESVPNWGSIFYDPVQESTFDKQYQIGKTQICDQFLLGCCSLDLRCPLHHTPFPFHWQLRRRAGYQWVSVSQSAQIHLEKLYCNADSDEAILNLLDNVFTLNFDSMTVCDSDNYDEVRRLSNTTKSDCNPHFPTVWKMYWRNDYDLFIEYDESISRQLEDAIQNRAFKCTFTQTGRQYEVDFSNLNQKNIATGFIREIRRRPVFRSLPALQPHLKTLSPNVFPGHGEAQPQVCLADPLEEFTCWYPPVWRPGPIEEEFTKIEVKLYEKAYLKVYELFHKTLSEAGVEIVNIYQIQNTFQWDKYRSSAISFKPEWKLLTSMKRCTPLAVRNLSTLEELVSTLESVLHKYSSRFHHPILSPLESSFQLEVDVLTQLLKCQAQISEWKFLPSLLNLHSAHSKLHSWGQIFEKQRETRKHLFGGQIQKAVQPPHLFLWLLKFKNILLAKFSFYFHEALSRQTTLSEMKTVTAKTAPDYFGKISSFIRKYDVVNVSLIFDNRGSESFQGHGYHHPHSYREAPKGVDQYPAVVSLPNDRPVMHWPNVIMIMSDRAADLNMLDKVVHFFDDKVQSTYYLTRPEPHFTIIVIFESKKSEKDSHFISFLQELSSSLKNSKPFSSLKPGSKG
ncbi:UNVERIFIED_CONTAM: hypothetical protein FKN15_034387 [Acipenser sinensis]